ncbi:MAG: hypothetical protein HC767_03905 [Akkermansiaceae bacterium]|nr:hypothetical protein [Akkermansiaceae bacterium]
MSDLEKSPSPAATPEYRAAQRWNVVWVVPILALIIGAWMIYRSVTDKGPLAHVRFETAEGILAKTRGPLPFGECGHGERSEIRR